jgi:parallel beta-helix repeat protein
VVVARLRREIIVLATTALFAVAVAASASTPGAASTPSVPSAPQTVSATAGNGRATVRWHAPASNGGSAITGYTVTPYIRYTALPDRQFASTATTQIVTGLTNGTTYHFKVAARNGVGTGPRSKSSNAITPKPSGCSGVKMTAGQSDIDRHPAGTTFCLSGTHHWTLEPKARDKLIGPAILDGGNSINYAIVATAPNVTLTNLTIQHYNNGNGTQDAAIHIDDDSGAKAQASGWHLNHLNVGFNSASGSGTGDYWTFTGGRFHDNRQEGIGGAMADHVTINGVEIDHNDFTNTHYTTRNWDCGDEAGGVKWVTNYMTIENSRIHNNACKGLWSDLGANHTTIRNNQVYGNWDEGIFIEISSNATITGNTVTNNGWHNYNGDGNGCPWLFGGGITLNSSDHVTISGNHLAKNCNGITGVQQDRPDGNPGLLEDMSVHNNAVAGPGGMNGVSEDNGANLNNRNIVFATNSWTNTSFCNLSCGN